MARADMIAALQAAGFDTSLINDAIPDEVLAEFLSFIQEDDVADAVGTEVPPDAAMADLTRDEMVAQLLGNGHTQDELDALDDAGVKALFDTEFPPADVNMADRGSMTSQLIAKGHTQEDLDALDDAALKALFDQEFPGGGAEVQSMSEKVVEKPAVVAKPAKAKAAIQLRKEPAKPVNMFSELKEPLTALIKEIVGETTKELRGQLGSTRQQTKELAVNQKRANVDVFCETLVKEGKLFPAQLEATKSRLMRANGSTVIKRFSENGKTLALTELDMQMEELRNTPAIVTFAERMKDPITNVDNEVAKVEAHYESFSEKQKKITTKEKMVTAFKAMRKNDPSFSAAQFCNIK